MIHRSTLRHLPVLVALVAALLSRPALAQDLDVAVHVGTLGLGADLIAAVQSNLGLRASFNYIPFDVSAEEQGVDYTLDLPTPQFLFVADFYPVNAFRLTGGVMVSAGDIEATGRPVEPVEIGNTTYSPAEVGTLTGRIETRTVSPYIGIGFGNSGGSRAAFFADLGVAFHGNPELSAEASGPVASLPGFQQDLDSEVQDVQDDIENVVVYPVFSVGISIRLGR
jgi:hypothetical protein